jgi:hypothetical protein
VPRMECGILLDHSGVSYILPRIASALFLISPLSQQLISITYSTVV